MAEKCPCKGDYLDKLVQPAILSVLCEGPAYGLELLRELERRHLADGADVTGFYRSLRSSRPTASSATSGRRRTESAPGAYTRSPSPAVAACELYDI